jgi:sigma-E factor negative regulatory protein RseC
MEKYGTVTNISGSYMDVKIIRDSACGDNCAACGLCGNGREMTLRLKNTKGFKAGDKIRLMSNDKSFLKYSAAGYLSLTALLISGGIIGSLLGGDWTAFVGAIAGLAIGVLSLKLFFKDKLEIETEKVE